MGGNWCNFTRRGAVSVLVLSSFSDYSDTDFSDWYTKLTFCPSGETHKLWCSQRAWSILNHSQQINPNSTSDPNQEEDWIHGLLSLYALHCFLCKQANSNHCVTLCPDSGYSILLPFPLQNGGCIWSDWKTLMGKKRKKKAGFLDQEPVHICTRMTSWQSRK